MAIIRFLISPQTHIRSTEGDQVLFRIPEQCPYHCGLPRRSAKQPFIDQIVRKVGKQGEVVESVKKVRSGCPHMLSASGLVRKKRLEKYNQYKVELSAIAKEMRFTVPHAGFAVYFHIPLPAYILRKDEKRREMDGALKMNAPDIDNYLKAFFDSLLKGDEYIAHLAGLGKYWTAGEGYIEVHTDLPVYDPRVAQRQVSGYIVPKPEGEQSFGYSQVIKPLVFGKAKGKKALDIFTLRYDENGNEIKIPYSPSSPAAYEGEKLGNVQDEYQPWMSYDEAKKQAELMGKYGVPVPEEFQPQTVHPHVIKSYIIIPEAPVDVNDKAAMDEVIKRNKKRKKK